MSSSQSTEVLEAEISKEAEDTICDQKVSYATVINSNPNPSPIILPILSNLPV